MSGNRWHVIAESNFPWERDALEWLRSQLPDREPWSVWTNFEFIDDQGKVNEVDTLVLSPAGLFLVEIKSRPGVVDGDAHTWTWRADGREYTYDNPLLLADRKSKRLASLLRRQSAIVKAKIRLPFIQPAIFLSSTSLHNKLQSIAKTATFQRGQPGSLATTASFTPWSTASTATRFKPSMVSKPEPSPAAWQKLAFVHPTNTGKSATTNSSNSSQRVKVSRTGKANM
ncbi:MAG: NERD domain-containing protein [Polaromonas sp.]